MELGMKGHRPRLDRRRFVKLVAAFVPLAGAAACAPAAPPPAPTAVPPTAAPPTAAAPKAASPTAQPKPTVAVTQAPPTQPAPTAARKALTPGSVATVAGNAFNAYLFLGRDKGFFAEQGIDFKVVEMENTAMTPRAVLNGEATVGNIGVPSMFPAIEQGAKFKIIGASKPRLDLVLYGRDNVKAAEDLAGKSLGVGAPGALLYQVGLALLREKGVDSSKVDMINLGSAASVFKAVVGGKVDAGISNSIYRPTAQKENIRVLAILSEMLPNYPHSLMLARNEDIDQNAPMLVDFLTGWANTIRYGLDHPSEIVAYMVQKVGMTEAEAQFEVEHSRTLGTISPDLGITPDMIRFPQEIEVQSGTMKQVLPFNVVVNDTLQKQMLARIGPYRAKRQ